MKKSAIFVFWVVFFFLSCLMWLKFDTNKFKILFLVLLFVYVILVFSIFCLVMYFVVTCFCEKQDQVI